MANMLKVPSESSVKLVGKMSYTEPTQTSLRKAMQPHLRDSEVVADMDAILEVMCTE
jgi:hypothetical protein